VIVIYGFLVHLLIISNGATDLKQLTAMGKSINTLLPITRYYNGREIQVDRSDLSKILIEQKCILFKQPSEKELRILQGMRMSLRIGEWIMRWDILTWHPKEWRTQDLMKAAKEEKFFVQAVRMDLYHSDCSPIEKFDAYVERMKEKELLDAEIQAKLLEVELKVSKAKPLKRSEAFDSLEDLQSEDEKHQDRSVNVVDRHQFKAESKRNFWHCCC